MEITGLKEIHYSSVAEIYLAGIATGQATFQTEAPSWLEWDKAHLEHSRFIATEKGEILGWAALTSVSNRCVYAGVAEVSIYISVDHRGKGTGSKLLPELIRSSEENNTWTLQAGIFPENKSSLHLHYKNGFRLLGTREKIGKMNGVWRDTILLERRSKVAGTD
ncbi:MAG: GNAT family N-acetyltransferase [Bacteroidia bacterium]